MKIEGSNSISDIEHIPEKQQLIVTFKSGAKGRYENVSATIHTRLMNSESKGSYLHSELKSNPKKYPYYQLGKEAKQPTHLSVKNPPEMVELKESDKIEDISSQFHALIKFW